MKKLTRKNFNEKFELQKDTIIFPFIYITTFKSIFLRKGNVSKYPPINNLTISICFKKLSTSIYRQVALILEYMIIN